MISLAALASSALLAAIWQGTLLALAVALCLRMLPRLSAAARSVIWFATFVAALLLHLTPLLPAHPATVAAHVLHADPRWSLALAVVWLLLSGMRAVQLVASALHLRRIARDSTPVAGSAALALPRQATLCTSTAVDRPSVAGFFAPRILIPPTLLAALNPAELEQVLLHETEHLRRGDDWTNLLQKLALVVFPLNPVLLWVERRLCLERELACDDRVLAETAARKVYAKCLTSLAEHAAVRRALSPALTLALGAWHHQSELARRVYRILATPPAALSKSHTFAAAGFLLTGVIAGATMLAHAPQFVSFAATGGATALVNMPRVEGNTDGHIVWAKAVMPAARPVSNQPRWSEATLTSRGKPVVARKLVSRPRRDRVSDEPRALAITYRSELSSADGSYTVSRTVSWSHADFRESVPQAAVPTPAPKKFTASPAPVLVPVFAYAAVPTPNGWLIIQL